MVYYVLRSYEFPSKSSSGYELVKKKKSLPKMLTVTYETGKIGAVCGV